MHERLKSCNSQIAHQHITKIEEDLDVTMKRRAMYLTQDNYLIDNKLTYKTADKKGFKNLRNKIMSKRNEEAGRLMCLPNLKKLLNIKKEKQKIQETDDTEIRQLYINLEQNIEVIQDKSILFMINFKRNFKSKVLFGKLISF